MVKLSDELEVVLEKAVEVAKGRKGDAQKDLCDILREVIKEIHPDQGGSGDGDLTACANAIRKELQAEILTDQAKLFKMEFKQRMGLLVRSYFEEQTPPKVQWEDIPEIMAECRKRRCVYLEVEIGGYILRVCGDGEVALLRVTSRSLTEKEQYRIPDKVTVIADEAFWERGKVSNRQCMCETLIIPASVKEIRAYAFRQCTFIKNVIFEHGEEDSLRLREGAFSGTNIKEVTLPIKTVIFIEETDDYGVLFGKAKGRPGGWGADSVRFVFTQKHLDFLEGQGRTIQFLLSNVWVRTEVFLEGVSRIPDKMFQDCSPSNMTWDCANLERVYINGTLEEIGDRAFEGCAKLSVICTGDRTDTVVKDGTWDIPDVREIGESAFSRCDALKELHIKSCEYIKKYAFANCKALYKIVFGSNLCGVEEHLLLGHSNTLKVVLVDSEDVKAVLEESLKADAISVRVRQ